MVLKVCKFTLICLKNQFHAYSSEKKFINTIILKNYEIYFEENSLKIFKVKIFKSRGCKKKIEKKTYNSIKIVLKPQ